jgi:hypothetical protein
MRCGIILAAALIIASATGAHAEQWCGYTGRPNSIIQCGYSSLEGCENAVGNGKGAICFVNPDVTLNSRRATPDSAAKQVLISALCVDCIDRAFSYACR